MATYKDLMNLNKKLKTLSKDMRFLKDGEKVIEKKERP